MYQIETKNYGHGMLNKLFPVSLPKKILFAIQFTVKVFSLSFPLLTQFINFSTMRIIPTLKRLLFLYKF